MARFYIFVSIKFFAARKVIFVRLGHFGIFVASAFMGSPAVIPNAQNQTRVAAITNKIETSFALSTWRLALFFRIGSLNTVCH